MFRPGGLPLTLGGLALCFLTLLAFPEEARGQTPRDSLREEVGRELVRILPLWTEAGAAYRAAQEERAERNRAERQIPVDTFEAGPFRVIAEPKQREMAQKLFEEISEEWGDALSGSEDLLEPWHFLVRRAWSLDGMHLSTDSLFRVEIGREFPLHMLRNKAESGVGRALRSGMPEDVREWIWGFTLTEQKWEWVARELASNPSFTVRRCFLGELDWCGRALGVTGEAPRWDQLYSPPERRLVVSRRGRPRNDSRWSSLWDGCVEHENLRACDTYLETLNPQIPASRTARASLLAFALRTGGQGSFLRLRQVEAGSLLEKMAKASGMEPDTLLATWRREALKAKPSAWAGLARTPVAALFWIFFFGFLAARSTRWRLG